MKPSAGADDRALTSGFSLVEVAIALAIIVFAVLSILGLFGGALKLNRESQQRIQAANLATKLVSQYQAALDSQSQSSPASAWPDGIPFPRFDAIPSVPTKNQIKGVTLQGSSVSLSDEAAVYGLDYAVWKDADESTPSRYVLVHLNLNFLWPVAAAVANPSGNTVENFELNTAFLVEK